jgi:hypothetical protein
MQVFVGLGVLRIVIEVSFNGGPLQKFYGRWMKFINFQKT